MNEKPTKSENSLPSQNQLTTAQRAMAAAREISNFATDAKHRQNAGDQAQDGVKGKAAARAALHFRVSTRLVELAIKVRKRGAPELVQAVENGKITVSTAAKLVKLADKFPHAYDSYESQRQAVTEIAAGRPVGQVLAAFGIQDRGPVSFDEETLKQAITQLKKLTDLRAKAFGPNDAYRQAKDHLDLYRRAMNRWRTERLDEPAPVLVDDFGRRVSLAAVSAFQTAQEMQITCGQVDALIGQIVGLSRRPGGELLQVQVTLNHLNEVRKAITDARPSSACDYCTGPTCSCRGRGWFAGNQYMNQFRPYRPTAPAPVFSETPTKIQASDSEPPRSTTALCALCRIDGYPHCPDCMIANDPGVLRGTDGLLYRTKPSGPAAPGPPEATASAQEPPPHPVHLEENQCPMCDLPPPGDKDCPRCQEIADFESRQSLARLWQITRRVSAAPPSALAYLNIAPSDTF